MNNNHQENGNGSNHNGADEMAAARARWLNAARKRRGNSPLWALPEEKQFVIVDFLEAHTLADGLELMAKIGVKTSRTALARFRMAYVTRENWVRDDAALEA